MQKNDRVEKLEVCGDNLASTWWLKVGREVDAPENCFWPVPLDADNPNADILQPACLGGHITSTINHVT